VKVPPLAHEEDPNIVKNMNEYKLRNWREQRKKNASHFFQATKFNTCFHLIGGSFYAKWVWRFTRLGLKLTDTLRHTICRTNSKIIRAKVNKMNIQTR
jgi:hypothetical protein